MSFVIDWVFDHRWAITEAALATIVEIISGERGQDEARTLLHAKPGADLSNAERVIVRNGVAIIDVFGPIFPRANIITEYSGATSLSLLAMDFNAAIDDPAIKGVVLNMDSPGGEVGGVSEFANMVFNARSKKPVIAYGFNLVASAGYWIASAASRIITSDTGILGSIGVATVLTDKSESAKAKGVKKYEIVSSLSPNKRPDPSTDSGRAEILKEIDALATVFVNTVAKNRGVSSEKVLSDFGRGGVLIGQNAVDAGMADEVGSLESAIESIANVNKTIFSLKGVSMNITELKEKHSAVYQAAFEEGVASAKAAAIEEGKILGIAEGKTLGATAERARIQGIESLKVPGAEKIIAAAKYNPEMTKADVAILACEELSKQSNATSNAVETDALALGTQAENVATGAPAAAPLTTKSNEFEAVAEAAGKNVNMKTKARGK